jgi:hypothetical protein
VIWAWLMLSSWKPVREQAKTQFIKKSSIRSRPSITLLHSRSWW